MTFEEAKAKTIKMLKDIESDVNKIIKDKNKATTVETWVMFPGRQANDWELIQTDYGMEPSQDNYKIETKNEECWFWNIYDGWVDGCEYTEYKITEVEPDLLAVEIEMSEDGNWHEKTE